MIALALFALAATGPLPKKGEPAITALTQQSGGPIDPDQAKLTFNSADLSFEVLPDTETLNGVATLVFTAKAPLSVLKVDLDRNLPVTAVSIDGHALPRTAWSNPEGRLAITLPAPVFTRQTVTARITYGGQPHVAVKAPWDSGMVWARDPRRPPMVRNDSGRDRLRLVLALPRFPDRRARCRHAPHHDTQGTEGAVERHPARRRPVARRTDAVELAGQTPQYLRHRAERRAV